MPFHNNRLRELPLFDAPEDKPRRNAPQDIPRAGKGRQTEHIKGFVKQEETSDKKRKRDETLKFQSRHDQSAVDAALGAGMDHIHHDAPFSGFNFTSANAHLRNDHYHVAGGQAASLERLYGYPNDSTFNSLDNDDVFVDHKMPNSSSITRSFSGDTLVAGSHIFGPYVSDSYVPNQYVPGPYAVGESAYSGIVDDGQGDIKLDGAHDSYTVSATPAEESDFAASDSEEERPCKTPKINKDGAPRKPRQPRPKLLKWNDDDWKNVCLGIVWACGETGVQIPFDQAAQVVGQKCTAGALQQALLKLRGKQIADGHQIPNLKMAWTRKNRPVSADAKAVSSQESEANRPRKKPTRTECTQSYIVTLPRAYQYRHRQGIAYPYKWKRPSRKASSGTSRGSADIKPEGSVNDSSSSGGFVNDYSQILDDHSAFAYPQPEMSQLSQPSQHSLLSSLFHAGNVARGSAKLTPNPAGGVQGVSTVYDFASQGSDYLPATPIANRHFYESPPVTPFGTNTAYFQGMDMGGDELAGLLAADGFNETGLADAADTFFAT